MPSEPSAVKTGVAAFSAAMRFCQTGQIVLLGVGLPLIDILSTSEARENAWYCLLPGNEVLTVSVVPSGETVKATALRMDFSTSEATSCPRVVAWLCEVTLA